ncbi:MAG: hypothetical protein ACP5KI_01675 [Brevinematia bacterium]
MLEPIISTLKYEISLFNKLKNSEFKYYAIFLFTLIIKHFSDYTLSKETGKPVSTFNYLDELKKLNLITKEEENLIKKCISISRRKDKLIEKSSEINLKEIEKLILKLKNRIQIDL